MSEPRDHDAAWNRDDDQKDGAPQRSATEPDGAEGTSTSPKTHTDPVSGEQRRAEHPPNQAGADQADGARPPGR